MVTRRHAFASRWFLFTILLPATNHITFTRAAITWLQAHSEAKSQLFFSRLSSSSSAKPQSPL
ncbi:hypothetical protein DL93DRAFT_2081446 [Clavulina sp. PMI_390]|nr:hypothetical protein DL93DRAFT_2081446 [Clavulina sp. PMI_390]